MRLMPGRLCSISIALIVAISALIPMAGIGTLSSTDIVPMPPGDFILQRSDHFDIYYDSSRMTGVDNAIVGAEVAYNTVTGFFGPYDSRVKIIIASNHPQYVNILTLNVPGAGEIADSEVASDYGYGERGTVVIESPDQLQNFSAVLSHDLTHIVMRTRLIDNKYTIPEWFSEGLAIYVSGDLSNAARAAVEESCRDGKLMTVAQMEAILQRADDPATSADEVSLASAQSGMLIEYIATKYNNESIKLIIQDFGPTGDLSEAFTKRLGYTPEDINADMGANLKGQLNVKDGKVLTQRVYGFVLDPVGQPVSNETIAFTSLRNDSSVFGQTYTAVTNSSGYYRLNMTYGPFSIHLDRPGYHDVDANITLQKNEVREYNATLSKADMPVQNVLSGPMIEGDQIVYVVLGVLNATAILLIGLVFWRTRK